MGWAAAVMVAVAPLAAAACSTSADCANGGACVAGACHCTGGYGGAACDEPPDPCRYPVVVHCGDGARCVDGSCERADACDGVVCGEHGRCEDGACACEDGFGGADCADVDECASAPCANGGVCYHSADVVAGAGDAHRQLRAAWQGLHVCACPSGYGGPRCECLDCGAHGACQSDGRCVCDKGFVGSRCEIDVNECASSPCRHGGTCADEAGAYSCSCRDGFLGAHCEEEIDECASAPCQNGGQCVDKEGHYACSCVGGWSGTNCAATPACLSSPCQNGAACEDRLRGPEPTFRCKCQVGWSGELCEQHACDQVPPPCENGGLCVPTNPEEQVLQTRADFHTGDVGFVCNCTGDWSGVRCANAPQHVIDARACKWPEPESCRAVSWMLETGCADHAKYVGGEAEGRRRCAKKLRKVLRDLPRIDRPCRSTPRALGVSLEELLHDIEQWVMDACRESQLAEREAAIAQREAELSLFSNASAPGHREG